MNQQSHETFSISQVSERTGVTENRIRDWHEKGFLPEVQHDRGSCRNCFKYFHFLISLSYATIIKTGCPPASPEHRDGGQAPGVLHHVMGRGIERRKIFIDKRDRQIKGSSVDLST